MEQQGEVVAAAIRELAEAINGQTNYLERRDEIAREDWLANRDQDRERTERWRAEDLERLARDRQEDWDRTLVLRGIDTGLASTLQRAMRDVPRDPAT